MSETTNPATEVNTRELVSYEFAFHILPTVAEGEVAGVFDKLKNNITKLGGEIKDEESPKRFDLSYDIVRYLEGKNRKFSSAYFGWVRFNLDPIKLNSLQETLDETKELLRFLVIKLTKIEEQNPFRFHDSVINKKHVIIDGEELEEVESEDKEVKEDGDEKGGETEELTVEENDSKEVK